MHSGHSLSHTHTCTCARPLMALDRVYTVQTVDAVSASLFPDASRMQARSSAGCKLETVSLSCFGHLSGPTSPNTHEDHRWLSPLRKIQKRFCWCASDCNVGCSVLITAPTRDASLGSSHGRWHGAFWSVALGVQHRHQHHPGKEREPLPAEERPHALQLAWGSWALARQTARIGIWPSFREPYGTAVDVLSMNNTASYRVPSLLGVVTRLERGPGRPESTMDTPVTSVERDHVPPKLSLLLAAANMRRRSKLKTI